MTDRFHRQAVPMSVPVLPVSLLIVPVWLMPKYHLFIIIFFSILPHFRKSGKSCQTSYISCLSDIRHSMKNKCRLPCVISNHTRNAPQDAHSREWIMSHATALGAESASGLYISSSMNGTLKIKKCPLFCGRKGVICHNTLFYDL